MPGNRAVQIACVFLLSLASRIAIAGLSEDSATGIATVRVHLLARSISLKQIAAARIELLDEKNSQNGESRVIGI